MRSQSCVQKSRVNSVRGTQSGMTARSRVKSHERGVRRRRPTQYLSFHLTVRGTLKVLIKTTESLDGFGKSSQQIISSGERPRRVVGERCVPKGMSFFTNGACTQRLGVMVNTSKVLPTYLDFSITCETARRSVIFQRVIVITEG